MSLFTPFMDTNNKNHYNSDLHVTTEANDKKRTELAYFGRICILLMAGCLTLLPGHSEGRSKSSIDDSFGDMPSLEYEKKSKYFQELIKMKWTEIESKLKKMSAKDSIKLLRTLSAVNEDASSLLDTVIDEQISGNETLDCDQISLFLKLARKYNLSASDKLREVLRKGEKTKEDYQFLMEQYIRLCHLIGSNAYKYAKAHKFLNRNGVISEDSRQIEAFLSDWVEYALSLEDAEQ